MYLPWYYSQSSTTVTIPPVSCAGATCSHHWNRLPLEVQERIVLLLPLQDLGRAVCLGKAFRSAFKQRLSQAEERLTSLGLAAFGKPVLVGVGRVLQRYSRNVDLLTGGGTMPRLQQVKVATCGTATAELGDFFSEPLPHAMMALHARTWGPGCEGEQDLLIWLRARDGGVQSARVVLKGSPDGPWFGVQTPWTAACFSPAVPNAAGMSNAAGFLEISLPYSPTFLQAGEFLGGFLLAARMAAKGPMCLETPTAPPRAADPVTLAFPYDGRPSVSLQETVANTGNPRPVHEAALAKPSGPRGENAHQPPERRAGEAIRRATVRASPVRNQDVPMDLMDQAITTAFKVAVGLQIPCCNVDMYGVVHASFALQK
jgi:hypothetical protein